MIVVEDDVSMSQALQRLLKAGGYAVESFTTAEAALESSAAVSAACWILDYHLPGMDGLKAQRRLQALDARPCVILITAHDEPALRAASRAVGVTEYLPKPFSGRRLLYAVSKALHMR